MSVIVGRALPEVRDGLKPVLRRLLYAMFDGGYRPDRGFNKCARVVGDVMGQYHPHGDAAIYDTLVRLTQRWVMRPPLIAGQGNFGSPGSDTAGAMRYTECRMARWRWRWSATSTATPSTSDRTTTAGRPAGHPARRVPNLLVNGSAGIAVGMATNIPPHNLGEVAAGVQVGLAQPEATPGGTARGTASRHQGSRLPERALIVGPQGIEEAYRTGRGSVIMRGVVDIEEDEPGEDESGHHATAVHGPGPAGPPIAELVNGGKLPASPTSATNLLRTGLRMVVTLRRDAQPRVVLNNLYKHTPLQQSFGCNMLALVDDVPRTLSLDPFVSHWIRAPDRGGPPAHPVHVARGGE